MAWRPAESLVQLGSEINHRWPNRSKRSDGLIGDAAHAASASDHNANAQGVVCAFDITHDPDNGPDCNELAEQLRRRRHPDAKYIIWNGRIATAAAKYGHGPWEWRPYSGADPHTNHIHVSVGVGPDGRSQPPYDDTLPWLTPDVPGPGNVPVPPIVLEDDMASVITEFLDWPGELWHVEPAPRSTDGQIAKSCGTRRYIPNDEVLFALKSIGVKQLEKPITGGTLYAEVK